jgi:hypothetical protein
VGIETYDGALGGAKPPKGERDAVAGLIASDEVLIRRFWGFQFDDERERRRTTESPSLSLIASCLCSRRAGYLRRSSGPGQSRMRS